MEIRFIDNEWVGVRHWKHYKMTREFDGKETFVTTYDPPMIAYSDDDKELTQVLMKEANEYN